VLHFAWPVRLVSRAVSVPLGGTAVLVAVALFLSAVRTFRTAIPSICLSRYSGVAVWVNSLWLLVTLMPAMGLMSFVAIPREEQYLETRSPSDHLPYEDSVRRWL
jgi:hypothetical protein